MVFLPSSTANSALGVHSSSSIWNPTVFQEHWLLMLLLGLFSFFWNLNHATIPGLPLPILPVEVFYFARLIQLFFQEKPSFSPPLGTLTPRSQARFQVVPCRTLPLALKVDRYFPSEENANSLLLGRAYCPLLLAFEVHHPEPLE